METSRNSSLPAIIKTISGKRESKPAPYYYGFGGWLMLFMFGLALQFLLALKAVYDNYLMLLSSGASGNSAPLILESVMQLILATLIAVVMHACICRTAAFRLWSLIYSAALSIAYIVMFALHIVKGSSFLAAVLFAAFWSAYILLSRRVHNTYGAKVTIIQPGRRRKKW